MMSPDLGTTVSDLDVATAFFVGLGLEVEGRAFLEGAFVDTVCGIPHSRTEIVMLRPPGGGTGRHEDAWLMAYVRGPDGIIVALAQRLG